MKTKLRGKYATKPAQLSTQVNPVYYFLFFSYLLIPTFFPNFYTLDSNGPKFLSIAILNLISFIILCGDSEYGKRFDLQSGFFRNGIGVSYTIFLVISLVSFCNAFNIAESVMNFVKIITVFSAAYMLFVIFARNRDFMLYVALALALLLLLDSLITFYGIANFISGDIPSIADIKSVYSKKNALAAAIFIKFAASLWLMFFTEGFKKQIGYITVFCALLSTLFLSTRAFYLGIGFLSLILVSFAIVRYIVAKEKKYLILTAHYTGIFMISLVIYTLTQMYLFPKNKDSMYNTNVFSRLSTVDIEVESRGGRPTTWQRSWLLIGQHPLLGVGSGNWKIEVLKYESPEKGHFVFMYKNHNDFIEVTAETGLFGGLAYAGIFLLIFYGFIKTSVNPDVKDEKLKYVFLPAIGLLGYSVDAFFNFPADRPEMQILFAIYIASIATFTFTGKQKESNSTRFSVLLNRLQKIFFNKISAACILILLCASIYFLFLNAKSLRFQRFVREYDLGNKIAQPASFLIEGFPSIPNVNIHDEPIVAMKVRLLISENRNREAIRLLLADNSSPYDSRREFYLGMAYSRLGMIDSSIVWLKRAYLLKPLHDNVVVNLSIMLFSQNKRQEAMQFLNRYLQEVKTTSEVWKVAANQYWEDGQTEKAISILDSALKYLPLDTTIAKKRLIMIKTAKSAI
jgi:O-antigen ligase